MKLIWLALGLAVAYGQQAEPIVDDFELPALKRLPDLSFTGPLMARLPGFDISGHTQFTFSDFIRLVPDQSFAYGGIFSTEPLRSKEWIVEVAFRVHSSIGRNERADKHDSGGRGLAFWLTKEGNPTEVTIPGASNHNPGAPAPQTKPSTNDPTDPKISLFGNSHTFDGLGVLFDSSPTLPLFPRSDRANMFRDPKTGWIQAGADEVGSVSAILDDATIKEAWIDKPSQPQKSNEAGYLSRTMGDCPAVFRNTNGLVWARIAHFNNKIYVHLDTSSHTTLSTATRRYNTHCFTINGVKIPTGYRLGLTGLASANPSPDAVDIYAIEAWEVTAKAQQDEYQSRLEHDTLDLHADEEHPLQGTDKGLDPAMISLATDLFKSHATMLAAIEALALRVDKLSSALGQMGSRDIGTRLSAIDAHLSDLLSSPRDEAGLRIRGNISPNPDIGQAHEQGLAYATQQVHKVMSELVTLQRQFEAFQNKVSGNLNVLTSRTGEIFTLVRQTAESYSTDRADLHKWVEAAAKTNFGKYLIWFGGAAVTGVVLRVLYKIFNRGEGGQQRGKKLI